MAKDIVERWAEESKTLKPFRVVPMTEEQKKKMKEIKEQKVKEDEDATGREGGN